MKTVEEAQQDQVAGIAASAANAGQPWIDYAIQYVYDYLTVNELLFCDDVWESGLQPPQGDKRAFGQVMKHAVTQGWMVNSGEARPSRSSNNSLRSIYISALYQMS